MKDHKDACLLRADQLESVSGGAETLGVYRPGFQYKKESAMYHYCQKERRRVKIPR